MIDLRSDTVTQPDTAMRAAMAAAPVGDAVYGEDPTVNLLEELAAKMLGKEAALFCTSGTQTNLLALMSHCRRGDEYIVGQSAHTYKYEGGGAAVLGSIQPQPLDFEPDGSIDLIKAAQYIKPDDFHFARTTLFCLENTQGGKILPISYIESAKKFARANNLKFHLDGARIFNAAVKLNLPAEKIASYFDTVSVCLSKGLGAPVGSVLCGPPELIMEARKWRKMLGGGMRQAGIIAAAGIYALENNIERLSEDHENALFLMQKLSGIDAIEITPDSGQTNMVFVKTKAKGSGLSDFLKKKNILISADDNIRLVTHLNIKKEHIHRVVEGFEAFFAG